MQHAEGGKMPTFETPPDWWLSLANLTHWAHWPAWAALFSLAALWNTARLATRASRRDERKDCVIVVAAAQFLDLAATSYEHFIDEADNGPLEMHDVAHAVKYNDDRDIMRTLNEFDVSKFPTVFSFKSYGFARHSLIRIEEHFRKQIASEKMVNTAFVVTRIEEVQTTIVRMREHARKSTTRNDWARLHGQIPPYSLSGVLHFLKSLFEWLPAKSSKTSD
jgi:hypothetical protein